MLDNTPLKLDQQNKRAMNVDSVSGFATFDYIPLLLESMIYEWNDLFGSKETDRNKKKTKTGNRILENRGDLFINIIWEGLADCYRNVSTNRYSHETCSQIEHQKHGINIHTRTAIASQGSILSGNDRILNMRL